MEKVKRPDPAKEKYSRHSLNGHLLEDGHLELVPVLLYPLYLTLYRGTFLSEGHLVLVLKVSTLESVTVNIFAVDSYRKWMVPGKQCSGKGWSFTDLMSRFMHVYRIHSSMALVMLVNNLSSTLNMKADFVIYHNTKLFPFPANNNTLYPA